MTVQRKDLIVLVADSSMAKGLGALLQRHRHLAIRPISFDVRIHPERDPGVRSRADTYLRPLLGQYSHAVAILDFEGCGREHRRTPQEITLDLERRLDASGWRSRSAVIIVVPEFDAWVWSDSRYVDRGLGWHGRTPSLREWLQGKGLLREGAMKPDDPKEARVAAMKHVGLRESSRIFQQLGGKVGVSRCTDPAFQLLLSTLRMWFPPTQS